ncbi:hypothetical protein [Bradyrhizobium sp. USDA 4504]
MAPGKQRSVHAKPAGADKQSKIRGAVREDRVNRRRRRLQKLVGLQGLIFHANVFRIDGGGLLRGSLFN